METLKTMARQVADTADILKSEMDVLLKKHSDVSPRQQYDELIVISPLGNHEWRQLSPEGCQLQDRIAARYRHFSDLIRTLIKHLPGDAARVFEEKDSFVARHIDQAKPTWCTSTEEAMSKTSEAIDTMVGLLTRLHSLNGEVLLVPDTNALIYRPTLADWSFTEIERFTIVFTPTVLSELDQLKMNHRVEGVRDKSNSLIRQIKDLSRRGDLGDKVVVIKGRIDAKSIAVEPRMLESLSWLDAHNNDDRLIASVIEIMRQNTRSTVALVSHDINIQNKARQAHIPVIEHPELTDGQPSD